MLSRFELILTSVCLALAVLFLIAVALRIRTILRGRNSRVPLWDTRVGPLNRAVRLSLAAALALFVPGVVFSLFIAAMPAAVVRPYAKALFCLALSAWALLEVVLCLSVPRGQLAGWRPARIAVVCALAVVVAGAFLLFPNIPRAVPFPAVDDCVMLELPVRGTWIAGLAGASYVTNGHLVNRYAIDILKLGLDGRMHKGREESVDDFHSYDQPVYAPADGQVTEVVNDIESDVMGNRDTENPGGNYVILNIGGGRYVYLAHMKRGSVAVGPGQFVSSGDLLGRVGNSGNSTHPHVHMHVQNKPTSEREGRITYPFRFREMRRRRLFLWNDVRNGYLLSNDWFSSPEEE